MAAPPPDSPAGLGATVVESFGVTAAALARFGDDCRRFGRGFERELFLGPLFEFSGSAIASEADEAGGGDSKVAAMSEGEK